MNTTEQIERTYPVGAVAAASHRHRVHFSSQSDEWVTPAWLFDALDREFGFTLDPCSTHANAKCPRHFTRAEDGLRQSWAHEVVWMNPPYGRAIEAWMAKAFYSCEHERATVVCLVPSRTDTHWWHRFAMPHEKRFLRGRLRFGNARGQAPFPSAIVVMRPPSHRFAAVARGTRGLEALTIRPGRRWVRLPAMDTLSAKKNASEGKLTVKVGHPRNGMGAQKHEAQGDE